MLNMDDEAGHDTKLIVVPDDKVFNGYAHIRDINDVVAGNKSAVPIGTRGMTKAKVQRSRGTGYNARPITSSTVPIRIAQASPMRSTIGPNSALRITKESTPT